MARTGESNFSKRFTRFFWSNGEIAAMRNDNSQRITEMSLRDSPSAYLRKLFAVFRDLPIFLQTYCIHTALLIIVCILAMRRPFSIVSIFSFGLLFTDV